MTVHNHGIDPSCRERKVGECLLKPGVFVLDLSDHDDPSVVGLYAEQTHSEILADIAKQIEAQTGPPRISEPGMGRTVKADLCTTTDWALDFLRTERGDWVVIDDREGSRVGQIYNWSNILNPILVREGVE